MPCDTSQEQTDQNQSAKRVNGGIRTPTDTTPGSFLSLLAVRPKQYNASKVNQSKEASNLSYLVAILRNHLSFWKEVEDCCHNSVMFADRIQKHFKITHGEYIYNTYYNYHPVGWNHDVGPKQSYESRLIFRHMRYIEKYRCYLLNKRKELPFAQRVDINRRLIAWIVKYLKLYQNSHSCSATATSQHLFYQHRTRQKSTGFDKETRRFHFFMAGVLCRSSDKAAIVQ